MVEITPVYDNFVAEIAGIDLREEPAAPVCHALKDALEQYAVLVIPDQPLDEAQQIRIAKIFGTLETSVGASIYNANRPRRLTHNQLSDISNLDESGQLLNSSDMRRLINLSNQIWHTDSSFKKTPASVSLLSAQEIAPVGGATEFADMRAAWDHLDDATKEEIGDLIAVHDYFYSRSLTGFDLDGIPPEWRQMQPPVKQVLVRTLPNGRRALYLASHIRAIEGMQDENGLRLLTRLMRFATRPQFVYRHRWRIGDLVVWDNRCTMHRGTKFDEKYRRVMRRATVEDDGLKSPFSVRGLCAAFRAIALGLWFLGTAAHSAWPDKPVTLVVPFGAGSGTDTLTRGIANHLTAQLGQTVVVDNKTGAGGGVGASFVARSAPDGYTLLIGTNGPMAANASLYSTLPYRPDEDFEGVALLGRLPMLLIGSKQAQAADVNTMIAQAKARPGALNFGASNTTARVWVELLKKMTGIEVETILYKDVGSMMTDLISGRIQYAFENVAPSMAQITADRVNGLAVTASQRAAFAPDIPTIQEYGLDEYDLVVWYAMFAPKDTPLDRIQKINEAVNEALKTPEMQQLAHQVGARLFPMSWHDMKQYQRDEIRKWKSLVEMTGIRLE